MKRHLSITTAAAALLVGTVFAAAQGVQRPGGAGGAEPGMQGGAQGQGGTHMAPQEGGKGKAAQPQQQPRTQGQGGNQAQGQGQATPEGQGKGKAQSKEPRTQGQGSTQSPGQRETQGPREGQPQQQGQQPKQQPQQGQQQPQRGENQRGAESGGAQSGGVTLTNEQRTHIRTTVLQGGNAPRVNNVNFSLNVGTVVPRTVTVVAVPPTLVEIHPAWRGYMYFIVGERIIIVEPSGHKIVAVLVV